MERAEESCQMRRERLVNGCLLLESALALAADVAVLQSSVGGGFRMIRDLIVALATIAQNTISSSVSSQPHCKL